MNWRKEGRAQRTMRSVAVRTFDVSPMPASRKTASRRASSERDKSKSGFFFLTRFGAAGAGVDADADADAVVPADGLDMAASARKSRPVPNRRLTGPF